MKKYNGTEWVDTTLRQYKTATDTLTTLPADVYADGTNATVGLKGNMVQTGTPTPSSPIQPQETGVRTENLFDYNAYFNSTFVPYNEFFEYATIQLLPNTTYTLSTSIRETVVTARETAFIVATTNQIPTTVDGGISNISPVTITTENDGILKLYKRISGRGIIPTKELFDDGAWLMLNEGSNPLPYEPYGYKIPISSAGQTTNVYLGEVQTTRKIYKYAFTGQEDWGNSVASNVFGVGNLFGNTPFIPQVLALCTEYTYNSRQGGYANGLASGEFALQKFTSGARELFSPYFRNNNYTTVDQWKSYLAAQYAAGTPVTVWYVLATETTGIVNEPLMKIGNYADTVSGITIPTIIGKDTFDVETTLKPSEVELTYTGWHDSSVEEWDGSQWNK